jgi:prevent-host-death family protein
MKTATVADLRNHFPRVFRWIEEGESVEVTKRGRVVARLVPVEQQRRRKFRVPDFLAIQKKVFGTKPSREPSIVDEERSTHRY